MPMYNAGTVYRLKDVDGRSFCFTVDQLESIEPATAYGQLWVIFHTRDGQRHTRRVERAAVDLYPELAALICEAVDAHWLEHGPKLLEALKGLSMSTKLFVFNDSVVVSDPGGLLHRTGLSKAMGAASTAIAAAEHLPETTE